MRLLCRLALISFLVACEATVGTPARDTGTGGTDTNPIGDTGSGVENTPAACADRIDNDGDGAIDCADPECLIYAFCSGVDTGPPDTSTDCRSVSRGAESAIAPVDIVWVIDNSGSMRGEADIVQSNMNSFVTSIAAAGLDTRVVVITSASFVTIPPPLGTDTESFLRIERDVQSSNSLEILIEQAPTFLPFLRRNSQLHMIGVTDDESRLGAEEFRTQMLGLIGRSFNFHAIASPPGSTHSTIGFTMDGCSGPNGDAADNGDIYWQLSMTTGGRQLSICTADWSTLFSDLTRAIAVPRALPCVYDIPDPPMGMEFDPARVNVEYTRGSDGGTETIPNVGTFDRCSGEGWYYDEEVPGMRRVVVCPNTCSRLESDAAGIVNIAFGCETLLI